MSVDRNDLMAFQAAIEAARDDVPEFMDKCAVGEGIYARDQARKICTDDKIVNNGDYRRNFKSGSKALRSGQNYKIDVYNNLDYAKPLEYGFRGHFVPGHWEGSTFVYQRNDPAGGMYVKFHRGHFTLRRAIKRTKDSQDARLQRKQLRFLRRHNLDGL